MSARATVNAQNGGAENIRSSDDRADGAAVVAAIGRHRPSAVVAAVDVRWRVRKLIDAGAQSPADIVGTLNRQKSVEIPLRESQPPRYDAEELLGIMPMDYKRPVDMKEVIARIADGTRTLTVVALRFEETLAQKNPRALEPGTLWRTWGQIVRHPTFWAYTLLATTSYTGLFTFLAAGSFVFIGVLGLSKPAYGLAMLTMSLSYIVGTFICRRLLPRFGVRRTVAIAGAATLTAGTAMGVMALMGIQSVAAIMVPFYLFMLGHGVHQPCGQSGAVGPFPQAAGAASALSGFLMMVMAFGMGGWLGKSLAANPSSVLPLTSGIWFWSVAIAATAWTLVQWHGEVKAPPLRVTPETPHAG